MLVSMSYPPPAPHVPTRTLRTLAADPGIRATAIPYSSRSALKDPDPSGSGKWWRQRTTIWPHRIAVEHL
jgi:hypothetical protein